MPISEAFEKLGRAIFESPFSAARLAEDVPELAEMRLVVLDSIKSQSHRVSGRLVFPFNRVHVRLSGVPEKQAGAFRSEFLARYFEQELAAALTRAGYRYPDDLRVDIEPVADLPGPRGQWVTVETSTAAREDGAAATAGARQSLVILHGAATSDQMILDKVRTNIGRTVDVFRSTGPSRRNDLAFAEDTEINRTVSREHAHIIRDRGTGECRIFNDRYYQTGLNAEENCGLWIVRDGLSQPVHRNSRGVALRNGDEIHLGRAVLQFVIEMPQTA